MFKIVMPKRREYLVWFGQLMAVSPHLRILT